MSESVAPANVDVVDRNERLPEPSVPRTCPLLPSADGKTNVCELATESGALRPTK